MTTVRSQKIVGLIGGIGSGKSMVAREVVRRGGYAVDADQLGHEALEQEDMQDLLRHRWGNKIFSDTNKINRRELGAIVFADVNDRRYLEGLVFPFIERRIEEEIQRGQNDENANWIVLDAAIMLETGWAKHCNDIVYVHTPRPLRLQRLFDNRGWSEKEVNRRAKAQLSLTEKVTYANFVVDNSSDLNHLSQQVDKLVQKLEKTSH